MIEPVDAPRAAARAEVVRRSRRIAGAARQDLALSTALGVLIALTLLAIVQPLVGTTATGLDLGSALQAPSRHHVMGTDSLGRDVFARVAAGGRISLAVAAIVVIIGAVVGGAIGIVAGAFGGLVDNAFMRSMDAILAFPPLILAMAVTVGLGVGLTTATIGIALTSVPWYARLLRSEVLTIRSLPFVEATVALGATRRRLILRHVLPHLAPTFFIQGAAIFGYAILALAALGFVGLGAQPPAPEWGTMITQGEQYALTGQWWIGVFPGVGLLAVVTATSVVADRARDILDPRGRYVQV